MLNRLHVRLYPLRVGTVFVFVIYINIFSAREVVVRVCVDARLVMWVAGHMRM